MAAKELTPAVNLYGDLANEGNLALAERLELTLVASASAPPGWHLIVESGELLLASGANVRFRLAENEVERRLDGFVQSGLAKACQVVIKPVILDALSGWGTDGLTMAIAGCEVVCCEVNPLVMLLSKNRMLAMGMDIEMLNDDAANVIAKQGTRFDVIYLDEMFPEHPKGALPSKALQVLSELAANCNIEQLLELAIETAKNRVVVKRRRNQPPVSASTSWSIQSRTVRFDVYATNNG